MDVVALTTVGAGLAGVLSAAIAVGVSVARPLRHIREQNAEQLRQQEEFREDWYGQPARPGREAQPGVMERLGHIEKELRPNSGSTLRDAINRVEQRLEDHIRSHQGGSS